jgi:hypothetical protein
MSDSVEASIESLAVNISVAPDSPSLNPTFIASDQEAYLAQYAKRNYLLYMLIVLLSLGASPFGDMSVFVPTLAMRLHAPTWIVALPTVVDYSISYIPILLLGWLMRARTSRTRVYGWSVAAMYLPILALAIALLRIESERLMVIAFCACVILYSLALGVTILPCWDLFARIFPDTKRSKIMGQAGALGQGATLLTAGLAGWLISSHSPLPYPKNYAVAMLIFASNGFACMFVIFNLKEYKPPVDNDDRLTFRQYIGTLLRIVRTDHRFRATLRIAPFAIILMSLAPVMLAYAVQYRGFTGADDKALFVACRPYVMIPGLLLLGYISHRIGPARVAGGLAVCVLLAVVLSFVSWGRVQLVPLLLMATAGFGSYFYVLLAVMRSADQARMHHYLAIYYTVCLVPGLAPLGLAWLTDHAPNLALLFIMIVAAIVAVGFLFPRSRQHG